MTLPDEFLGRIIKTKIGILDPIPKNLTEIQKQFSDSYLDVIYENMRPIIVLVFESREDCLLFKLKYGDNYV